MEPPFRKSDSGVWQMSDDETTASVLTALELGYRHIDTAAIYGNEAGVGRAIAECGIPREEIYVTTKLWNDAHQRPASQQAIEESLEKLGLSYVDLYLIHWPVPSKGEYVQAWESLIDFRSAGLATSIGTCNFLAPHLDDLIDETGIVPAVNQIELHPTLQPNDLINHTTDLGIAIESWSPLGRSADLDHPVIERIAAEIGATTAQVILRWHLDRGFIVIPKSKTPSRIESNLASIDVTLTAAQREAIDSLAGDNRVGPDPATFAG